MIIIQIILFLWASAGLYYWVKMPKQKFKLADFLIGLPLCILFWPRIKK